MRLRAVTEKKIRDGLVLGIAGLVCFAGWRISVRVDSTMIGYDLGRLKSEEADLLQQRSQLRMELAKLTSKSHLEMITGTHDLDAQDGRSLAAK